MPTLKYDRDNLVNLIAERATFERAAVTLYDAVLHAIDDVDHPLLVSSTSSLVRHRAQEVEHAEWAEDLLGRLGGTPQRDLSDAVLREARTLLDVVSRARKSGSIFTIFHAMLSSELMDTEGWKLLLEVADDLDDKAAVSELRSFVEREDEHLALIRHLMLTLTKESVAFMPRMLEAQRTPLFGTTSGARRGDGAKRVTSAHASGRSGRGTARAAQSRHHR